MPEARKLLKGTAVLTFGRLASYGLSFLRNIILARALSKADFGLAAVFGMAMTLLEVSGRMAYGQQVIQSKEGETPRFIATAHALQFLGGTLSAVFIASLSIPLAQAFGVPHAWPALLVLSVVPVFQGLSHLDIARRQRRLDYFPLVMVDLAPQALITAAAWPLAQWVGDYRAIVWLILVKSLTSYLLSLCFARHAYRWAWDRRHARSMVCFGWPLLINGLVMFGCQHADQLIVGAAFSLDVLAGYALAFSLVSIPYLILGQVALSLMLPLMSRAQDDMLRLRRQYRICAQVATLAGVVCLVPMILSGEQLIALIYGSKYAGSGNFMSVLGAAAAIRFLRFAPAVAALAKADTLNQLISNAWRATSIPLAIWVWKQGGTPVQIACCGVVGELLATIASAARLARRQNIPLKESLCAFLFMSILISFALIAAFSWVSDLTHMSAAATAVASLTVSFVISWFALPEAASCASRILSRSTNRIPVSPLRP